MAHGLNAMLKRGGNSEGKTGIGSRRIFAPAFKLQVLDSYRNDADCKGNQRATARKYGIHRRQIQKWLQVEGNLRNTVLKSKCGASDLKKCGLELTLSDRQQDDVLVGEGSAAAADKRVPDIPQPVYVATVPAQHEWRRGSPVDSMHSQSSGSSFAPSPPAPLDFTTHTRRSLTPELDPAAPIDLSLKPPRRFYTVTPTLPPTPTPAPEPVALPHFSPCVPPVHPDIWDLSTKRPLEDALVTNSSPRPVKLFKPYLDNVIEEVHSPPAPVTPAPLPVITKLEPNDHYTLYHHHSTCSEHHNNNNYHQPDYQVDYTLYNDYYYNGGLHFIREPFSSGCVKQRQSYSVDFKLSAIECYYSDAVCRGNQRAVASKFKIHRRQVQKWLKQEDQLRQRVQPLHIVR